TELGSDRCCGDLPRGEVAQVLRYPSGKGHELVAGGRLRRLRRLAMLTGRAGICDQPLLLRLPEPAEFRHPRAAIDAAEEHGQVIGVARQGADRRLREVSTIAQAASDHPDARERILAE